MNFDARRQKQSANLLVIQAKWIDVTGVNPRLVPYHRPNHPSSSDFHCIVSSKMNQAGYNPDILHYPTSWKEVIGHSFILLNHHRKVMEARKIVIVINNIIKTT